jgi:hypothetical protein
MSLAFESNHIKSTNDSLEKKLMSKEIFQDVSLPNYIFFLLYLLYPDKSLSYNKEIQFDINCLLDNRMNELYLLHICIST